MFYYKQWFPNVVCRRLHQKLQRRLIYVFLFPRLCVCMCVFLVLTPFPSRFLYKALCGNPSNECHILNPYTNMGNILKVICWVRYSDSEDFDVDCEET